MPTQHDRVIVPVNFPVAFKNYIRLLTPEAFILSIWQSKEILRIYLYYLDTLVFEMY